MSESLVGRWVARTARSGPIVLELSPDGCFTLTTGPDGSASVRGLWEQDADTVRYTVTSAAQSDLHAGDELTQQIEAVHLDRFIQTRSDFHPARAVFHRKG